MFRETKSIGILGILEERNIKSINMDVSLPPGQQQARIRWGTQESGAAFDRKKRSYLTEQAQAFLAQRAWGVITGRGPYQELDAQMIMEQPGFIEIVDQNTCLLHLHERFCTSLLWQRLYYATLAGCSEQVGLLFMCHLTRQRLCIHAEASLLPEQKPSFFSSSNQQRLICVRLHVRQSFFHCSKYIRTRIAGLTAPVIPSSEPQWHARYLLKGSQGILMGNIAAFLTKQVSCFLCTMSRDGQCTVNHRGGAPGFLLPLPPERTSPGGTLLLPDYAGNGAYEALGNILETGMATLLVPQYAAELAVCLAGTARIWEGEEVPAALRQTYPGALRFVTLAVQRVSVQSGGWSPALIYERMRAEAREATPDSALACPLQGTGEQIGYESILERGN